MFYVLSGELEHIVNGKSEILTAGMTGYVKPPDKIRHKTGPAGAKVVVIWVPGDEAGKIARDAYLFGYPLVTMHLTKAVITNI